MKKKVCAFFFEKNGYHTISIFEIVSLEFFLMASYFKIAPNFFFNRKLNLKLYSKTFSKKSCMQTLIFCLHKVILDTQKLGFFSGSMDFKTG